MSSSSASSRKAAMDITTQSLCGANYLNIVREAYDVFFGMAASKTGLEGKK